MALAFGFTLLVMAYAVGPISGCHINPAVTLGMWMSKKIQTKEALLYMVAQVIGAILAAGILFLVASGAPGFDAVASGFGSNGYGDHSPGGYDLSSVMLIEVVLTFFLMMTVLLTTDKKAAAGFRGHPDRYRAGPDPPDIHTGGQHLGEPRQEHRSGHIPGRMGA